MIFEVKYELKIVEESYRIHQEKIDMKKVEDSDLTCIRIFVGEEDFKEDLHFLEEWSPEFQKQAHHGEIDLLEFNGNPI